MLMLLLMFVVSGVVALRFHRRYAANWHGRYRMARIGVGFALIAWLGFVISNLTNRQPFWPREALSLFLWTGFLGIQVYQWQHARRKTSETPLPPSEPPTRKPPAFLRQAVLILLPVVILAVVGLIALGRDRAAVENEARQRAEELIQQLQDNFGRRVAAELSTIGMFSYQYLQHERSSRGGWPGSRDRLGWEAVSTNYPLLVADWQKKFPDTEPEVVFPNDIRFDAAGKMDIALVGKSPPEPPDWLESLTTEQRAAWLALNAPVTEGDLSSVSNRATILLATNPSDDAQANARFILLRKETQNLDARKAIAKLRQSKWADRRVLSESGLPLGTLIFAEMVQRAKDSGPTEELWGELSDQIQSIPSYLTPLLLEQVESLTVTNPVLRDGVAAWRTLWRGGERARGIAEAIRERVTLRGITTTNLWVEHDGLRWFCILKPGETQTYTSSNGVAVTLTNAVTQGEFFTQRLMEHAFANALRDPKPLKPEYFGYSVELEGKPLTLPSPRGASSAPPPADLLAVGEFHMWQPGVMALNDPQPGKPPEFGPEFETLPSHPKFILRVHLADRARLFAAYRQRLWLFGGLILVSAMAALVGVFMARRAFLREQRLNEMKSNFVSSVSHELRAPIASVRLLAESLERGKVSEPAKQNEYFRFIVQECRRLSSLIENVLDFSRIEQGRKQYELEPTNVAALVEQTVKLLEPYAAERGVYLKSKIQNPKSEMEVDGRAIQQALVNLIDNAIKHSPKGETVLVELLDATRNTEHAARIEDEGRERGRGGAGTPRITHHASRITLSVTDHGPGIPASEREKIFERFHRLGSELRRETQGVGIGLSIVKHIVAAHGGRVRVESEVGKGSRFTIDLPLNHEVTKKQSEQ